MDLDKFDIWTRREKIIFFLFLCDHAEENTKWRNYLAQFHKDIKPNINWWVEPQVEYSYGFGFTGIFDFDDMDKSEMICNEIFEMYNRDVLMVISNGNVRNFVPISRNEDEAFIKPRKLFNNLIKKKAKGIYVLKQ